MGRVTCVECEGEGGVTEYCLACNGSGEGMASDICCLACGGSGVIEHECESCNGQGEVNV